MRCKSKIRGSVPARPRETLDEQIEELPERDRRRWKLQRAASQWMRGQVALLQAGDRERGEAAGRAMNALLALARVLDTLTDSQARSDKVQAAIRVANEVYRVANRGGETAEKHAAMELVAEIRAAASAVLDEGARIEEMEARRFALGNSDVAATRDQDAFRAAVQAWVDSEQAMRRRGRTRGRTPDRWGPTLECLKRFGLQNGIADGKNLARTWREARPGAVPLTDFD
jgi:hypothetical protein